MFRIADIRERAFHYRDIGHDFIAGIDQVRVFGVGCLEHDGDAIIRGMSSGYYDANVKLQLESYITDGQLNLPEGDEIEEGVLLWGDKNFGHWIFTYLNRLPMLFMEPQLLEKPLLVLDTTPEPYLDWLHMMGFSNFIRVKDGTRVNRLWVPSVVHYRDEKKQVHVSADAVHGLRHLLRGMFSSGSDRIYISRDKAKWRKVENEDALVELLSRHGVKRIFMEDLSAEDQLRAVSKCSLIVSVIGASSPITMLAPKSCRIVEIGLPGFSGIFGSAAWAHILGQPYERIDGAPVTTGINSNMIVNLKELDERLQRG